MDRPSCAGQSWIAAMSRSPLRQPGSGEYELRLAEGRYVVAASEAYLTNRLFRVDIANYVAGSGCNVGRLALCPDDQRHVWINQLGLRPIRHVLGLGVQPQMFCIADDTDDLRGHVLIFHRDRYTFAQRILAGQIRPRECLVDHDDVPHFFCLLLSEKATTLERDLHRLKIIRVRYADSRG